MLNYKTLGLNIGLTGRPLKERPAIMRQEELKLLLLEYALNEMPDGIQIYDRDASLVFINQASRNISGIPGHLSVEGKHLLDLYDLDEEISTVLTCLRTSRPVINRFDNFKAVGGTAVASVNTAYPIFESGRLIGSVVFDQNLDSLDAQIEKLEVRRKTIQEKVSLPVIPFHGYQFSDLIGSDPELSAAINLARKISRQDINVLLVGETGTGKEIFAQSIHKSSDRRKKKLVAINCAAVPDTLIESMFFGTSKGSFTGSVERPGLLEEANGGILFLDELNSMSLGMQSKLLRVIQEGSFRRVGSGRDIRIDVRFISSCNEDPAGLIARNALRKDLFYRLSAVTIDIPPLRERRGDVDELVGFYLAKNINRYLKSVREVSPLVLESFRKYHWPGNVRELFNVMEFVLNTVEEDIIEIRHLPRHLQAGEVESPPGGRDRAEPPDEESAAGPEKYRPGGQVCRDLDGTLRSIEKQIIEETLARCRYRLNRAAASLGLSRQTLQYRIKKLGIEL